MLVRALRQLSADDLLDVFEGKHFGATGPTIEMLVKRCVLAHDLSPRSR
jgi:hypothetical protein